MELDIQIAMAQCTALIAIFYLTVHQQKTVLELRVFLMHYVYLCWLYWTAQINQGEEYKQDIRLGFCFRNCNKICDLAICNNNSEPIV